MKINSISNIYFGRIYIAEDFKHRANTVLGCFSNESSKYDRTIDFIQYNNYGANIWIDNSGKVDYQIHRNGPRCNTDDVAERTCGYLCSFRERVKFALDAIKFCDWDNIKRFTYDLGIIDLFIK